MAPDINLDDYLKDLTDVHKRGDAREESFYPALRDLIDKFADAIGRDDSHVTIQPSATEAGNPDLRVWNGTNEITGYIEAKSPTTHQLQPIEESEQLERYRETFPNLILTNFFEFRLYRNGQMVKRITAAQPGTMTNINAVPPAEDTEGLWDLLQHFFSFSLPKPVSAEDLAVQLARRTRFFRDIVENELEEPDPDRTLRGFHEAFQKFLIGSLSREEFADLYAQTVTYGLFAARTRTEGEFNRRGAYDAIPHTIGVLRDVFRFISLEDPSDEVEWIVDDIAHCLSAADPGAILERYFKDGRGSDPIVHFYETFLAEYDPKARERRGVFYTPEPVVDYIVRSLNSLLKDKFDKTAGLASEGVTTLDPAAGTMTFVARAARQAVEEYESRYGSGGTERFIREHILENFFAFELMMAPYAVGHLKMSFFLEELGRRLGEGERFKFYLTNTLEMEELEQTDLPGMASLAEESRLAGEVKREKPILVIFGNPPYSGHSANRSRRKVEIAKDQPYVDGWDIGPNGTAEYREKIAKRKMTRLQPTFIGRILQDYFICDGEPLGERNPKWLQDDYVKFLRFAQWKMEQVPHGVVGMITNHSYLDNPTFRGMRQSLMETFDEIHVLDLHGNSLKRETCPDGSKDENVFDIRQGVAIAFFVKTGKGDGPAKVWHHDLWGVRQKKYGWLGEHDINSTEWKEIAPKSEFYLYQPRDEAALDQYNEFQQVTDLFPVNSVGIVTSRDNFVIDFDRDRLVRRIRQFQDPNMPDEIIKQTYNLHDKKNWKLSDAREEIRSEKKWKDKIIKCLYRPFDCRWIFYESSVIERDRKEVMWHLLDKQNLAFISCRQLSSESWSHLLVTNTLTDDCYVSNRTKERGYVFPLYLYPEQIKENSPGSFQSVMIFESEEKYESRRPNIDPKFYDKLTSIYEERPEPEAIFYYIYAVLHAPAYREKYADFLKIDFPKVPFTADSELFYHLADLGERLVNLHLLESSELDPPITQFHGKGDYRVVRRKSDGFFYDEETEQKYINETQYFAPIPLEVWEYQVGGYQVCHKWLKDRKERELSNNDIQTYCKIVTALSKTIDVQEAIDALYPAVEEEIIEMDLGD